MDIRDRTILILGGGGLVGHAIARRLLTLGPRRVVLVALYEDEVRRTAAGLEPHRGAAAVEIEWGNVFLPAPAARVDRAAALADPALRRLMLEDLVGELTPAVRSGASSTSWSRATSPRSSWIASTRRPRSPTRTSCSRHARC